MAKSRFLGAENSFKSLTSNRVYSFKENINENLYPTVGKLNKFATNLIRIILCYIAIFDLKITTEKR